MTYTEKAEMVGVTYSVDGGDAVGTMTVTPGLTEGKAAKGSELTLTANPKSGYRFKDFTVNGTVYTTNPATVTASTDLTIVAHIVKDEYQVTLNYDAEQGTVTISPALPATGMVATGTQLTVAATPKTGYRLGTITAGAEDITTTKKVTVTGNTTINVTFVEDTYPAESTIAVNIPQGPTGANASTQGSLCSVEFTDAQGNSVSTLTPGQAVTVTVTPVVDYNVKSLSVGGQNVALKDVPAGRAVATAGPAKTGTFTFQKTMLNAEGKLAVAPAVEAQKFKVSFAAGVTNGYFTAYYGDGFATQVPAATGAELHYGTKLRINAVPGAGYKVASCTIGTNADGRPIYATGGVSEPYFTATVTGDVVIGGQFMQAGNIPFSILTAKGGKVTAKRQGSNILLTNNDNVSEGEVIEITVTPDDGMQLKSLTVGGTTVNVVDAAQAHTYTCTVPDDLPEGNKSYTVYAVFEEIHPAQMVTWTAPAATEGTLTVMQGATVLKPNQTVPKDETITITVVPAQPWLVPTLTINSEKTAATTTSTDATGITTYTYDYVVKDATNITVKFDDNRKKVTVLLYQFSGQGAKGTITLYSDAECTKALATKSYGDGWYQISDMQYVGSTIYGKVNATSGFDVKVYEEKKGGTEYPVVDGKFAFSVEGLTATPDFMKLVAVWEAVKKEYTVSWATTPAEITGIGSINVNATGDTSEASFTSGSKFKEGTVISGTIEARDGYKITGVTGIATTAWTDNTANSLTRRTFSFELKSNVKFNVTFAAIPEGTLTYTINNQDPNTTAGQTALAKVKGYGSSSVTVDGAAWSAGTLYREGSEVSMTVNASSEYKITGLATTPAATAAATIAADGTSATATVKMPTPAGNPKTARVNATPTFAHRTLTVNWSLNNADQLPKGMVTVTAPAGANGTSTQLLNNQTGVWTDSEIIFKASPTTGYKVTGMTITDGTNTWVATEETTGTAPNIRPTGNFVYKANTPASDMTETQAVSYSVNVTVELLPVKVYFTAPAGANAHGAVTLLDSSDSNKEIPANVAAGTDVKVGHRLILRAVPDPGYQVKSITVNGTAVKFDPSVGTVVLDGANCITVKGVTRIAVEFELKKYQVSVFSIGGTDGYLCANPYINNAATGNQASFTKGSRVTINANIAIGYKIQKWVCNGEDVMASNGTALNTSSTLNVTVGEEPLTYHVVCEKVEYKPHMVTAQTNSSAWPKDEIWGEVRFSYVYRKDNSNPLKEEQFTSGKWTIYSETWIVTMEAQPKDPEKHYFVGWQTNAPANTYTIDPTNPAKVTYGADNNATFTAVFGRRWSVSTVDDYSNGTLELRNPAADNALVASGTYFDNGTVINAVAKPDHGYRVACWIINGKEYTISAQTNQTVTYRLTLTADTQIGVRFYDPNAKPPTTGIDEVEAGTGSVKTVWYSIQGRYLGEEQPTAPGVYIKREGGKSTKVIVR